MSLSDAYALSELDRQLSKSRSIREFQVHKPFPELHAFMQGIKHNRKQHNQTQESTQSHSQSQSSKLPLTSPLSSPFPSSISIRPKKRLTASHLTKTRLQYELEEKTLVPIYDPYTDHTQSAFINKRGDVPNAHAHPSIAESSSGRDSPVKPFRPVNATEAKEYLKSRAFLSQTPQEHVDVNHSHLSFLRSGLRKAVDSPSAAASNSPSRSRSSSPSRPSAAASSQPRRPFYPTHSATAKDTIAVNYYMNTPMKNSLQFYDEKRREEKKMREIYKDFLEHQEASRRVAIREMRDKEVKIAAMPPRPLYYNGRLEW